MKYEVIKKIKELLFSLEDVRKILGLKYPSAKVFYQDMLKMVIF
jgi:prophage antirepressor-like protein